MKRLAVIALAASLAACSTPAIPPAPTTPAQAVYELTATYQGALTVALTYDRLPTCAVGVPPACAMQANRTAIKHAVDRADPLVLAAQTIARATSPDASALSNALSAAGAAVGQLTAITTALKVK
jgi:hypothetical protein